MRQEWIFEEDNYDLDGLLRMGETVETDFIFMIQEDEGSETYYMDRYEVQKYDSNFHRFMMRVTDYLEKDETHGLFVLFAKITGENVMLFGNKTVSIHELGIGDIEVEEDAFYGMMIQYEGGNYIFNEALYIRESYQKDAHAQVIHHAGGLTEMMEKLIFDYN